MMNIDERDCTFRGVVNRGAYADDHRCAVYLTDPDAVTTWEGKSLGTFKIVSEWEAQANSWDTPTKMRAVRIHLEDGRSYFGRYSSEWSQLCKGRRLKK